MKQEKGQEIRRESFRVPMLMGSHEVQEHPQAHTFRCPSQRRTPSYRDLPYNLRIKCPLSWDLKGFLSDS
jgi:hypothetical protein